ncbi:MAG: cyclodeaminase/cyclohydrolase family protein [Ignavibacteriaceae bacterium]|nr:cyclodeaminase/cyclohydrolase family protein [Ignavibacteriaceae bacterium]
MDTKKSIQKYLEELSSNSPTPGGGNVAALCGALAASLGTMVCNLTIGKKKYLDVENEMQELKEKLNACSEKFISLGKSDNEAFDRVMDAFKLPKETDEQKILRSEAIEKSTIEAANVPAEVLKTCREVIPFLKTISKKGNQNSLSDVGVAIALIQAAAMGAYLNVLINYSALKEKQKAFELINLAELINNELLGETQLLLTEIKLKIKEN